MPYDHGLGEILIDSGQIQSRIDELAALIQRDYEGKDVLVLAILRGSLPFLADLSRRLELNLYFDFLAVTRRGEEVRLLRDLDTPIAGRHVLLVEDIVNEGITLYHVLKILRLRKPATLKVCTMFNRSSQRKKDIPLDYIGYEVPDRFLVGYGLDYKQLYRNLPHIALFHPSESTSSEDSGKEKLFEEESSADAGL